VATGQDIVPPQTANRLKEASLRSGLILILRMAEFCRGPKKHPPRMAGFFESSFEE
jgi:hypothetical protein